MIVTFTRGTSLPPCQPTPIIRWCLLVSLRMATYPRQYHRTVTKCKFNQRGLHLCPRLPLWWLLSAQKPYRRLRNDINAPYARRDLRDQVPCRHTCIVTLVKSLSNVLWKDVVDTSLSSAIYADIKRFMPPPRNKLWYMLSVINQHNQRNEKKMSMKIALLPLMNNDILSIIFFILCSFRQPNDDRWVFVTFFS